MPEIHIQGNFLGMRMLGEKTNIDVVLLCIAKDPFMKVALIASLLAPY